MGNNDVIYAMKDSQGEVWLATYGGGLNLISGYDNHGVPQFNYYDTADGLANNICMAITEDREGYLWISTHNAVSRFNKNTGVFSNYTLYDDMRNATFSEATTLTTSQGEVLFGTGKNICVFDATHIAKSNIDYKLRFTDMSVKNAPVAIGEDSPLHRSIAESSEVTLPYNYSNFRVEIGRAHV